MSTGSVISASSNGEDRVFLSDTSVSPAVSGAPTDAEITTAAGANTNTVLYYTGSDTSTDVVTYAYWIDNSGSVTQLDSPSAGGSIMLSDYTQTGHRFQDAAGFNMDMVNFNNFSISTDNSGGTFTSCAYTPAIFVIARKDQTGANDIRCELFSTSGANGGSIGIGKVHEDGSGTASFTISDSGGVPQTKIQTADVFTSTATIGQVLTLTTALTGECEFNDIAFNLVSATSGDVGNAAPSNVEFGVDAATGDTFYVDGSGDWQASPSSSENLFTTDLTLTSNRSHVVDDGVQFFLTGGDGSGLGFIVSGSSSLNSVGVSDVGAAILSITSGQASQVQVNAEGILLVCGSAQDLRLGSTNDPGTTGQKITSNGPNLPPTWESDAAIDDQSASGYVDIGSVRIQWGQATASSLNQTVTFPVPFASTTYSVICTPFQTNTGTAINVDTRATTNFRFDMRKTDTVSFHAGNMMWQAIGVKP